jgi:hypothetical protein
VAWKRRRNAIGLAALAATVVLGAIAWAAPSQTLNGSVSPNNPGTKKKPTNVDVAVSMTTSTSPPSDPLPTTTKFQLFLPKEVVSFGHKFRYCFSTDVPTDCPNGSRVGQGSGSVVVGATPVNVTLTVYNGRRGKSWLLRMQAGSPFAFDEVIRGNLTLFGRRGYGHKLVFTVPEKLQAMKLKELNLDVGASIRSGSAGARGGAVVPFLGLGPCRDGELSFKTIHTYAKNPTEAKATATDNCG